MACKTCGKPLQGRDPCWCGIDKEKQLANARMPDFTREIITGIIARVAALEAKLAAPEPAPGSVAFGFDPASPGGDRSCKVIARRRTDGSLAVTSVEYDAPGVRDVEAVRVALTDTEFTALNVAAEALRRLMERGEWPAERWTAALRVIEAMRESRLVAPALTAEEIEAVAGLLTRTYCAHCDGTVPLDEFAVAVRHALRARLGGGA